MRPMAALATAALLAGCASPAVAPVLTAEDVLRVVADHDAARMPAALVTGRRLGMTEALCRRDTGWPGKGRAVREIDADEMESSALDGLRSDDPEEAFFGMQFLFLAYRDSNLMLDPNLRRDCIVMALPPEFVALRRLALDAPEPVRGRALAVLVSVRDSVDFDSVRATAAAARGCTREPLASALREEMTDGNLLRYVEGEVRREGGSRDGKWALQVLAAEKRGDLGQTLLAFLEYAANPDYGLALADFFAKVGGPSGVAGLRHLVEKAGSDGREARACAKGALFAFYSLREMLPDGPEFEGILRAALFANRGDLAGCAAHYLEQAGVEPASIEALDRAIAMAARGELDLDGRDIESLRTAREAMAARLGR